MGVAEEKMGRYAVNCKKTAACKSRKRSAMGERERTLKEKYEMYQFYKENKCVTYQR
jgi:hypothetical protein